MTILSIVIAIVVIVVGIKAFGFVLKNISTIAIGIIILAGGFFVYQQYQHDIHSFTVAQLSKNVVKIGTSIIK